MFANVAAFEFRHQLKNPVFWVSAGLFFLLTFASVTIDEVQIGASSNVHVNSPYAMAQTALAFSLIYMFASTAFVANGVVRDDETQFGPIVWATPISKATYLYARFLGAFGAVALAFFSVPLATALGSLAPWVDPEKLGPFRLGDYLYTYSVLAVPGLFLTCAGFFALATATRSMMGTYLGVVGVLVLYTIVTALAAKPDYATALAYLDPLGLGAVDEATRYWTVAQRNSQLPPLAGPLLVNRLLWLGAALCLMIIAYRAYRPRGERGARRSAAPSPSQAWPGAEDKAHDPIDLHRAGAAWVAPLRARQFWVRTRLELGQVFKSPAFFVLLSLGVFNAVVGLWFVDGGYGVAVFPVTRTMINVLRGAFSLIPLIVAVYYSGELVWRETDRGASEIIDAAPVPDWIFSVPKILAVALVLLALLAASTIAAVLVQLIRGYTMLEIGKYLGWYVAPLTVSLTTFAVLCVFVQALVPHKFVGWLVMVAVIILMTVMSVLGFEHNLYRYGGGAIGPLVPLSDMNGQGRAGEAAWWFRGYWGAIALSLAVLTCALWRRGKAVSLGPRVRRLPGRLGGAAGFVLTSSLVCALGLGTFIFVNTNVWNRYHTQKDDDRWTADYEKALLRYETFPSPTITDVKLTVALYPDFPRATTAGVYGIENKTTAPIREVHVRFNHDLKVVGLSVEGARPKTTYERFNYRIFRFDTPMAPGEKRQLSFQTELGQRGFTNRGGLTNVVANGTFLSDLDVSPLLGMDRTGLLEDRSKRRRYGLKPELRMPKLEESAARRFNLLRKDSDWVTSDITLSTAAGQIPIAPGYKISDVVKGDRRTAHFVSEAPINHFFSLQSARYASTSQNYKGVDLSVFNHPGHPWNVERMLAALKLGLDYDQSQFSPYQFRQVRILEFPALQGSFAQSFANTIPYSEDIGFTFDTRDPAKIDMATYVTAHELAHQWWAHQVIGANMQGSTLLDETLAQYSALMAMERLYGRDQIRKFLKYELDGYLRGRGGEALEEQPLERVENQSYICYRKGSLAMYRLKEVLGEAAVNQALRGFLQAYAFKGPPFPRSLDLIAFFRHTAGPDPEKQQLITDLFEKITLYDLKATSAVSRKRPDGRYDVAMTVSARKSYADGLGRETHAPMNEPVSIGLFAKEPGKPGFTAGDVVLSTTIAIQSGQRRLAFVTDRPVAFAGVDPYNTLINRNSDQNLTKVAPAAPGSPPIGARARSTPPAAQRPG